MPRWRTSRNLRLAGALAGLLMTPPLSLSTPARANYELRTVSSRPDVVSGGDVLVEVTAPSAGGWNVRLASEDVTRSFQPLNESQIYRARLSVIGRERSSLELRVGGRLRSHIEIVDHPLDGPIFSGPRQEPFICQTIEHGLGPALDSDCNAKTLVQYYYKSTEPTADSPVATIAAALGASPRSLLAGFKVYDTSKPPPADVARVEISGSGPVNYIIRREVGVINRAIYDVKFLHQPGEPLPTPWTGPNRGWNGRLVYLFGGGCSAGYRQGTLGGAIGVADELLLSQGYATATSTLNIPGNDCNDRVSAETLSMVKEHFIKEYGEPTHTIGFGGSGGATQQQLVSVRK